MARSFIKWSILLIGGTAMASQIIFLREFFVLYKGNELSIGIFLCNWLIWGAFGSSICGKLVDKIRFKYNIFSIFQFLLAGCLLVSFLLIRISLNYSDGVTGELIGYPRIFIDSFILLSIPCSIMGLIFTLGCAIYKDILKDKSRAVTSVYILEALGALFGGFFAGYILLKYFNVFTILSIFLSLNIFSSAFIQMFNPERFRTKKIIRYTLIILSILFIVILMIMGSRWLDEFSIKKQWKGFTVLESADSIYGKVTLTKRENQISFYENGIYLYSIPDIFSAEEIVHYNMLQNEAKNKVLLIGGGLGGCLDEILKYDIERVDYVEIDTLILELGEKYLDDKNIAVLSESRVRIINQDGRYFIKRAVDEYDNIILNVGDPYNAQINRFYTVECFREISNILSSDGIFSFTLTSNENYISDEAGEYLNSIYRSARKVFPDILIIPGDITIFLMSKEKGKLKSDPETLISLKDKLEISNYYVEDHYMFDKLSPERLQYAKEVITKDSGGILNKDFNPVSYYFSIKYWSTQLSPCFFSRVFSLIKASYIWISLFFFSIFIFAAYYCFKNKTKYYPYATAVLITGFTEILSQIIIIIAFQVIYGFVFQQIALIFTSFMAGLALGSWLYRRWCDSIANKRFLFEKIQISIIVYTISLPLIFIFFRIGDNVAKTWLGSNLVLPFLPLILGLIGGIQFPLANDICFSITDCAHNKIGRISGMNYGLDLLGAAIGAIIASAIMIPIIGIIQSCVLVFLLNIVVYLLLKIEHY